MFLGKERAGKSTMMLATAVCIATGTIFLGRYAVPKPRPVIYVSAEDRTALLQRRARGILQAHHPDMNHVACRLELEELERYGSLLLIGKDYRHPDTNRPLLLTEERSVGALLALIERVGSGVVYLDSLMRLTGGLLQMPDPRIVEEPLAKLEAAGVMVVVANHDKTLHQDWGRARSGAGSLNLATAARATVLVTPRKRTEHQRRQLDDGWIESAFRCRLAFDGTEGPGGPICDVETVIKMPPDHDATRVELVSMTAIPVQAAGPGTDYQKAAVEALANPELATDVKDGVKGIRPGRMAKILEIEPKQVQREMKRLLGNGVRRVGQKNDPTHILALA
jgi:hypothetical protein